MFFLCVLKIFFLNKNLFFYLLQIYLFFFLDYFDILVSKIIFKNKKYYFIVLSKKKTLKNNYYHKKELSNPISSFYYSFETRLFHKLSSQLWFFFFLFSKQRGLPIQHKKYFLENWKRTKEGVSNKQIIISLFCLKHTIHANWCLTH